MASTVLLETPVAPPLVVLMHLLVHAVLITVLLPTALTLAVHTPRHQGHEAPFTTYIGEENRGLYVHIW